jgi:hypothetical protein
VFITGESIELHTPAGMNYTRTELTASQRTSFAFGVMACSHSRIALSRVIGLTEMDTYEIIIGTDTSLPPHTVQLLRNGIAVGRGSITAVSQCVHRTNLWVSWKDGVIQFGKGNVIGQQVGLTWKDSDPIPVSAVSLSGGPTQPATWYIDEAEGL